MYGALQYLEVRHGIFKIFSGFKISVNMFAVKHVVAAGCYLKYSTEAGFHQKGVECK